VIYSSDNKAVDKKKRTILVLLIISSVLLFSCKERSMEGMIVFTMDTSNNGDQDSIRILSQAKIAAIDPEKPGSTFITLTDDFYSAMSPDVSFDGKYLLFAAKHKENDPWQLFEMNLNNRKIKQITTSRENCIDPAWLPNGRIVFSMIDLNSTNKSGHALYTCEKNGSDLKRITFNPHSYSHLTVLKDGRILTVSRQLYPEKGETQFMVLRPDGTKSELFYKGLKGSSLLSKAYETESGRLVFIESQGNSDNTGIVSVTYNNPLHSHADLSEGMKGSYRSAFPLSTGKLLVSWRKDESERYGLFEFDPVTKTTGRAVFNSKEYNVSDAVVVGKRTVPKKLPSEVDPGVKTGLLLCQDVNVSDIDCTTNQHISTSAHQHIAAAASSIEVMGADSSLGTVPVEKDGSFYLRVIADQPFRIRVLDEKGNVLGRSCSWIWIRPNERRGCVGCHEDHEQVPENKVPLAVKKAPANIPVHISKVNEKKVELE
jgi:hypothetical protein